MSLIPLLRSLPPLPTHQDVSQAVEALARQSALKRQPLKSIAAYLRTHRAAAELTDEAVEAIMIAARRVVEAQLLEAPPAPSEAEYCGEDRAAAILGISAGELRTLLIDPLQRRAHGYPLWTGREWRFPLTALRPATRPTYIASLPDAEPLEELLPEWCRRSG